MEHYHLTPSAGRWTLTRDGNNRAVGEYERRSDALLGCAEILRRHEGSLQIHRADGSVEAERIYTRPGHPAGAGDRDHGDEVSDSHRFVLPRGFREEAREGLVEAGPGKDQAPDWIEPMNRDGSPAKDFPGKDDEQEPLFSDKGGATGA